MDLLDKLRKIEALFEGAKTAGERHAAALAKERLVKRLQEQEAREVREFSISLGDRWNKRLFVAICNKYGFPTYRYKYQRYTTTMVQVKPSFMDEVLWPEFQYYSAALEEFLGMITEDLIAKIHIVEEDIIVSDKQALAASKAWTWVVPIWCLETIAMKKAYNRLKNPKVWSTPVI